MTTEQLRDLKPGDLLEWRPGEFAFVHEINEWPSHFMYGLGRHILARDIRFPGGGYTYGAAVFGKGERFFPKLVEAR